MSPLFRLLVALHLVALVTSRPYDEAYDILLKKIGNVNLKMLEKDDLPHGPSRYKIIHTNSKTNPIPRPAIQDSGSNYEVYFETDDDSANIENTENTHDDNSRSSQLSIDVPYKRGFSFLSRWKPFSSLGPVRNGNWSRSKALLRGPVALPLGMGAPREQTFGLLGEDVDHLGGEIVTRGRDINRPVGQPLRWG